MEDIFKIKNHDLIEQFIVENLYLTGSRAFGVETECNSQDQMCKESDYDYICNPEQFDRIKGELDHVGILYTNSNYFLGIFFRLNMKTYNLICVHHHDYNAWVVTTETIKSMCSQGMDLLVKNKRDRVALFESLRNTFKMIYNERSKHQVTSLEKLSKQMVDRQKLIKKIDDLTV